MTFHGDSLPNISHANTPKLFETNRCLLGPRYLRFVSLRLGWKRIRRFPESDYWPEGQKGGTGPPAHYLRKPATAQVAKHHSCQSPITGHQQLTSISVKANFNIGPLLQMHRIDEAHLPVIQRQDHRTRSNAFPEEPHALQQVSIRHARACKNHFLAGRQILGVVNALRILYAHFCQPFGVLRLAHHQPRQNLPIQAAQGRRRQHALGRTARAHHRMRAPAARMSAMIFSCRGRSNTTTTRSSTSRSSRFAMDFKLSATGASRSTAPLHDGPTTSFSMYKSGACSKPPRSLAASTAIAFAAPVAQRFVPSSGSTAMSTCGNKAFGACVPSPTFSPMYNIGASSRSPSPITIVPSISTESIVLRIASTATSSAWCRSPNPMVRAAAIAAFSTTRKKSRLSCSSIRLSPQFPVPPAANHRPNALSSSTIGCVSVPNSLYNPPRSF